MICGEWPWSSFPASHSNMFLFSIISINQHAYKGFLAWLEHFVRVCFHQDPNVERTNKQTPPHKKQTIKQSYGRQTNKSSTEYSKVLSAFSLFSGKAISCSDFLCISLFFHKNVNTLSCDLYYGSKCVILSAPSITVNNSFSPKMSLTTFLNSADEIVLAKKQIN